MRGWTSRLRPRRGPHAARAAAAIPDPLWPPLPWRHALVRWAGWRRFPDGSFMRRAWVVAYTRWACGPDWLETGPDPEPPD